MVHLSHRKGHYYQRTVETLTGVESERFKQASIPTHPWHTLTTATKHSREELMDLYSSKDTGLNIHFLASVFGLVAEAPHREPSELRQIDLPLLLVRCAGPVS
eukprot:gb/GECG01002844.1/.p1 GENE.gb/GECG01002844.1/~~gb/GECG01002844.1/.p1  ORF type:complete len:103 (+),score=9.02 gb/GECG01002844.1/:1-309(+)